MLQQCRQADDQIFTCFKEGLDFARADYIIALIVSWRFQFSISISPRKVRTQFDCSIDFAMGIGRVLVIAGSDSSGGA